MRGDREGATDSPPGAEPEEPGAEYVAAAIPEAARSPESVGATPDLPDASEVPADLRVTFWTLVFVIKFALIATSLGALFLVFEGRLRLGGGLLALGALLFASAVYRYRRYRRSADET